MKYFSMFSGIGGFELGIGSRGECVGFSEIDKSAIKVYKKHFPEHKEFGDATGIIPEGIEDFELLCGGFPCQSFSIAGNRGGFKDTRGTLFFEIARILAVKRPKLLLLENVKGLLSHDNGRTFGTILSTLSELGYICEWQIFDSKDFGVIQTRPRVFILGHLRGKSEPGVFPILRTGTIRDDQLGSYIIADFRYDEGLRPRRNGFIPTLTKQGIGGISGVPLIYDKDRWRFITEIEAERLQGFPDNWTDCVSRPARYGCCGNAVTVNVIKAIMDKLLS
jgi:DNA (cytosine-5)-methyltransferase 1